MASIFGFDRPRFEVSFRKGLLYFWKRGAADRPLVLLPEVQIDRVDGRGDDERISAEVSCQKRRSQIFIDDGFNPFEVPLIIPDNRDTSPAC